MELTKLYEIAELYLEYLSVFLSWPVMVALVLLIFFYKFHTAIDYVLRNLRILTRGGHYIHVQPQTVKKDKTLPESETFISKQLMEIEQTIKNVVRKDIIPQKEIDELREKYSQSINDSYHWKWNYLNLFFVENTKWLLLWLSIVGPQSRLFIVDKMSEKPLKLKLNYEQIVLGLKVLKNNELIKETDGLIEITSEGRLFLSFIDWNLLPKV